jgi:SAM-dependent methyltransferase
MAITDKAGLLPGLKDVALDLGCGPRKRIPTDIGIDALDYDGVDLVGDVYEVLAQIGDCTIDRVSSYHFMEHVVNLPLLLTEIARVLKPGGKLEVVVPHFSNPYYYSDHTHRNPFGLYTFSYLAEGDLFRRAVPQYSAPRYRLLDVQLRLKAAPPFYGRYAFKRAVGFLVNSSRYMQELYEESFCYLVPCYEIAYRLETLDGAPARAARH